MTPKEIENLLECLTLVVAVLFLSTTIGVIIGLIIVSLSTSGM